MTVTTHQVQIPNYLAGTYAIDQAHSEVGFSVRHMMVSKVRGRFGDFAGEVVLADNPLDSSVTATIQLASIDTNNDQRDAHIRSADFFDVEKYPAMTFRSTGVRQGGDGYLVDGDLTLKGVTKGVTLELELNGFNPDPWGGQRVGFTATTQINRNDFGVDIQLPIETGGVVVGDKVTVTLEIEAVRQ